MPLLVMDLLALALHFSRRISHIASYSPALSPSLYSPVAGKWHWPESERGACLSTPRLLRPAPPSQAPPPPSAPSPPPATSSPCPGTPKTRRCRRRRAERRGLPSCSWCLSRRGPSASTRRPFCARRSRQTQEERGLGGAKGKREREEREQQEATIAE